MARLGDLVLKVRSKNAGPFWLTIDIFCGSPEAYQAVSQGLTTAAAAKAFAVPSQMMKRFDIPDLSVVKLSLPRPAIQGTAADRDMHGASFAAIIAEMEV